MRFEPSVAGEAQQKTWWKGLKQESALQSRRGEMRFAATEMCTLAIFARIWGVGAGLHARPS
jgi:hypothetical protein